MKYSFIDLEKLKGSQIACITLDLEQDHGGLLKEPSHEAFLLADDLINYFKEKSIPLTCFVQGSLFETHPEIVEDFSSQLNIEFELHTYSHPELREINHKYEIKNGKNAFYNFFGNYPKGYRSQAGIFNQELFSSLSYDGFKFDSSIIPSLRPGFYNGLNLPSIPHRLSDFNLNEFPITTFSKLLRIPVSLSYLKLLGKPYTALLNMSKLPNFVNFSFHLHDLKNLNSSKKIQFDKISPIYGPILKRTYKNDKGMEILDKFINILLKRNYNFLKLEDFYNMLILK